MSMTLTREFLGKFLNDVFVETGTYDGRGVLLAKEVGFKTIHSIELDPLRAARSRDAISGIDGVTVHEGDTVKILPEILSTLKEKATIFLDAHPLGAGDRCKIGEYRYPLPHELKLIAEKSLRRDHTIIVDDRHEFPLYPTTEGEVVSLMKAINPNYSGWIEGDMMVGKVL